MNKLEKTNARLTLLAMLRAVLQDDEVNYQILVRSGIFDVDEIGDVLVAALELLAGHYADRDDPLAEIDRLMLKVLRQHQP